MRGLKFRAWHEESKEYVYFNNAKCEEDIYISQWFFRLAQDGKLEQYTGLKDKNGKEIFERDIVRWYIDGYYRDGIVIFDMGSFWLDKDLATGYSICNDWYRGEYEIIGNIHENPELLK